MKRQSYTQVTFKVHAPVRHGETIRVVGDIPALGSWNVDYGEDLETSQQEYPTWSSATPVPIQTGKEVNYKYAIFSGGKFDRWETYASARTFTPEGLERKGNLMYYVVEDTIEIPNMMHDITVSKSLVPTSESSLDHVGLASNTSDSSVDQMHVTPHSEQFARFRPSSMDTRVEETDGILVVCYFLPLTIERGRKGKRRWEVNWDENALLSRKAYTRADNMRVYFIGCPRVKDGVETREEQEALADILLRKFSCIPVHLPKELHQLHYWGFCEGKLRQHMYNIIDVYGPLPNSHWDKGWHAYSAVNKAFADKIVEVFVEGDIVWIHGYELLILPSFLARRLGSRSMEVGLFLHCPFPSSEIFRSLAVREELLRGMLNADHIGFHLYEYARHFLTCCRRILKLHYYNEGNNLSVDNHGRKVAISVCHSGIEPEFIRSQVHRDVLPQAVESLLNSVGSDLNGKTVVVAIDRLEKLSGVYLKLLAWEELFMEKPELASKVCLVQILTASREETEAAEEYCNRFNVDNEMLLCRKNIQAVAARINRKKTSKVIHCIEVPEFTSIERMALFTIGDILMLTPLREGLGLHPFEFLVVHDEYRKHTLFTNPQPEDTEAASEMSNRAPILILSEFSASSRVLSGSIRVNPWKVTEVAAALDHALSMTSEERIGRSVVDSKYVTTHTFGGWTERVLADVKRARNETAVAGFGFGHGYRSVGFQPGFVKLDRELLVKVYKQSSHRLILLDYGGTTVDDEQAFKSQSDMVYKPSEEVIQALRVLCDDPHNLVFIVSGKERAIVETAFADLPSIGLTAEHGYYYSWPSRMKSKSRYRSQDKPRRFLPKRHDSSSSPKSGASSTTASIATPPTTPRSLHRRKWECLDEIFDDSWMELSRNIMDVYVQRTSGTCIEEKGSIVLWQYRDADPEFGDLQAAELQDHLEGVLKAFPVEVLTGKTYVEVRPQGIGKDKACEYIINKLWPAPRHPDIILCVGDDVADENMFEYLHCVMDKDNTKHRPEMIDNTSLFTVVVGQKPSYAQFFLDDEQESEALLSVLAKVSNRVKYSKSLSDMRFLDAQGSQGKGSPDSDTPKQVPKMKQLSMSTSLPALAHYFQGSESPKATLQEYLEHIAEDDEGIYF